MDEVFYFVHNAQYSMSALTDAAGNVLEHYRYQPYGQVRVYVSPGVDGEWFTGDDEEGTFSRSYYAFTGRRLDPESGLYYFRNRYYAAGLGRFITRDPAGYVDGLNMYRGYFVPNGVDGMGLGGMRAMIQLLQLLQGIIEFRSMYEDDHIRRLLEAERECEEAIKKAFATLNRHYACCIAVPLEPYNSIEDAFRSKNPRKSPYLRFEGFIIDSTRAEEPFWEANYPCTGWLVAKNALPPCVERKCSGKCKEYWCDQGKSCVW